MIVCLQRHGLGQLNNQRLVGFAHAYCALAILLAISREVSQIGLTLETKTYSKQKRRW
jgi:hypothetical protein